MGKVGQRAKLSEWRPLAFVLQCFISFIQSKELLVRFCIVARAGLSTSILGGAGARGGTVPLHLVDTIQFRCLGFSHSGHPLRWRKCCTVSGP